jgi:transcriptional regulator with XRE-family HTH domain
MKNAKPKKVAARSATAVDAYIGARIRERRHDLEMSQHALAKALGVTYQQIQKYESGTNRVSAARLFEICKALKVPLSSIFPKE